MNKYMLQSNNFQLRPISNDYLDTICIDCWTVNDFIAGFDDEYIFSGTEEEAAEWIKLGIEALRIHELYHMTSNGKMH